MALRPGATSKKAPPKGDSPPSGAAPEPPQGAQSENTDGTATAPPKPAPKPAANAIPAPNDPTVPRKRGRPSNAEKAAREAAARGEEDPDAWRTPERLRDGRNTATFAMEMMHMRAFAEGRVGFDKATGPMFVAGVQDACAKYLAGGGAPLIMAVVTLWSVMPVVTSPSPLGLGKDPAWRPVPLDALRAAVDERLGPMPAAPST